MTKTFSFAFRGVALVAMLFVAIVPAARADELNHKTIFTINRPVQVAGEVVLPAGSYVLKRQLPSTDPRVLQIMDLQEKMVYATVLGIPSEIERPSEQPVIVVGEAAPGTLPALKAFYYPGSTTGLQIPAAR